MHSYQLQKYIYATSIKYYLPMYAIIALLKKFKVKTNLFGCYVFCRKK